MTSSTDKTQAVTDGTTTTSEPREHGLSVLRRSESQGLIQIACDALWEANRMADQINRTLYSRTAASPPPLDVPGQLLEVLGCLETADHYLRMLDEVIDTADANTPVAVTVVADDKAPF
jgi:hypothetical protein